MKLFTVSRVFQPSQVFIHSDPFTAVLAENLKEAVEKLGGRRLRLDEVSERLQFGGEMEWRAPKLFKEDCCVVLTSEKENGELLFLQELPIFL